MGGVLVALRPLLAPSAASSTQGEILVMAVYVFTGMVVYFAFMGLFGRDILRGLIRDFRPRRR